MQYYNRRAVDSGADRGERLVRSQRPARARARARREHAAHPGVDLDEFGEAERVPDGVPRAERDVGEVEAPRRVRVRERGRGEGRVEVRGDGRGREEGEGGEGVGEAVDGERVRPDGGRESEVGEFEKAERARART